jgi:hypothetical protein
MLRKLVFAGAVVASASGFGLAAPAYAVAPADGGVRVTCRGPVFGPETNRAEVGDILAAVTATGNAFADLFHDESSLAFNYRCGNGSIEDVGNRTIRITR